MSSQRENETSHRSQSGFSIIELMIAMVVILVGFISIVGISIYVSRANYTSNTLNVLASAAQDQVDRLRTAVWNSSTEDPSIAVGGSVEIASMMPSSATSPMSASSASLMSASSASLMSASSASLMSGPSPSPSPSPSSSQSVTRIYAYTLDPDDPHSASVANTPAGDLSISWQIRQGTSPDLRYVTIRVAQTSPSRGLERGYTVSTIIVRN